MTKRARCLLWAMVFVVAMAHGPGAWAAAPAAGALPPSMQRFGEPLSDEQLAELDGEWAHILWGGLYGGLGAAINYTIVYYDDGWDWYDFGRSTAIGAVSGAAAALFGGPFYSTVAGSLTGGLLDRWW